MGNTPSAEAQRRTPHKLSKPRTSYLSTAGLLSPHAGRPFSIPRPARPLSYPSAPAPSPTVASAPSDGPAPAAADDDGQTTWGASSISVRQHQQKEQRELKERKERNRRSLFRSKSTQQSPPEPDEYPSRQNSIIGSSGARTSNRVSRTNSMTYESAIEEYYGGQFPDSWLSAGSRASWNYDLTSYEAKRLLNLVEEPTAAYEHSSVVSESQFTVISENTWKSSHPAQPESTSISRANSDLSLYTPVRRRSIIQTPGVATRTRSNAGSSKPNYRHSHPPTPSLSRQASAESMGSRVLSMPPRLAEPESVPRVVTPCEGDYKTIGAFKLGSLRITNGAASPTGSPGLDRSHKARDTNGGRGSLDYFSSTQNLATGGASEAASDRVRAPAPALKAPKPISPTTSSFVTQDAMGRRPVPPAKDARVRRPELAGEYLASLSFTPFSIDESLPASPTLQITSKHTAMEDQLFEEDGNLEYSSEEVLDVRLDPNAKSSGERPRLSLKSVARSDSGFISSPTSETSHKPLSKADSGYSSNVSLRSLRGSTSGPPVPEKPLSSEGEQLRQSRSPSKDSFYIPSPTSRASEVPPAAPRREAPPPPPPPKDYPARPGSGARDPPSASPSSGLLSTPSILRKRHAPSPINSTRSRESGVKSPHADSMVMTPTSAKSDVSAAAMSIGSGSHKPGKLQRLLSLAGSASRGPPSMHATHAEDLAHVPSIPQNVEAKFREHSGLFPMTTKRLALRTQLSKDTLKTIFSVGSMEVHGADPQPAGPHLLETGDAAAAAPEAKVPGRRHTFQASSLVQAAASVLPLRKPIVRKPVAAQAEAASKAADKDDASPDNVADDEAELSTYSSINSSLGNNAYDAAFMAMHDERDAYFSPAGRTMSMMASLERGLEVRMAAAKAASVTSESTPLSPSLPSPVFTDFLPQKKTKTPPPVSMVTQRRPGSLRVPPPLRPQSTPPRSQSVSRKSSRDSVRSHASVREPAPSTEGLASPPVAPRVSPRRSMTFRDASQQPSRYQTPSRDGQSVHSSSRRGSTDQSRSNSMTSQAHVRSGPTPPRPTSALGQGQRSGATPPLRHRASYDGYGNGQRQDWSDQSQQGNVQLKPYVDPWSDPTAGQWDQGGRYPNPPYVPRGHHRNRSMGNRHGQQGQLPYRILHSYNSPAYRGVPIWG